VLSISLPIRSRFFGADFILKHLLFVSFLSPNLPPLQIAEHLLQILRFDHLRNGAMFGEEAFVSGTVKVPFAIHRAVMSRGGERVVDLEAVPDADPELDSAFELDEGDAISS